MPYTKVKPSGWGDNIGDVVNGAALNQMETGIATAQSTAEGKVSIAVTNPTACVEYSTGNWTGNPPAGRVNGQYPYLFIGLDDPADATNGVDTPANIRGWDVWVKSL